MKGTTQNDSKKIQKNHEYICVYVKTNFQLLLTYNNQNKKRVFKEKSSLEKNDNIYFYEGTINGATGNNNRLLDRNNLGYTIYYFETEYNIYEDNNLLLSNKEYNDFKIFQKKDKIIHAIALNDYDISNLNINSKEQEIYRDDEYLISLGYCPIRPPKRNGILGCWTWGIETFKKYWNNNEIIINNNKNVIKKEFVDKEKIFEENGKIYFYLENILPIKSLINIGNVAGTKHLKEIFGKKYFLILKMKNC